MSKGILQPDYKFESYKDIKIDFLKENNIKTIISDLDATLAPQDEKAEDYCHEWIRELLDNEINIIIVSNNTQERVDEFTKTNSIVGYGNCKKPSTEKINTNLVEKGLDKETTVFLGDQLFTDMLCAEKLGVRKIYVEPIKGKEHLGIKLKRKAENIVKKSWEW